MASLGPVHALLSFLLASQSVLQPAKAPLARNQISVTAPKSILVSNGDATLFSIPKPLASVLLRTSLCLRNRVGHYVCILNLFDSQKHYGPSIIFQPFQSRSALRFRSEKRSLLKHENAAPFRKHSASIPARIKGQEARNAILTFLSNGFAVQQP